MINGFSSTDSLPSTAMIPLNANSIQSVSIYDIYKLNTLYTLPAMDYIVAALCVIMIMVLLQIMVQKSANYSVPQMIANMKKRFSNK